jgi:hypothetical protein
VYLLSVCGVLSLSSERKWISAGQCTVLENLRAHGLFCRYVGFFVSVTYRPWRVKRAVEI